MKTVITDGMYFLHPADECWRVAEYRGGEYRGGIEESLAATHAAANDQWAGIIPSEDDEEIGGDEAEKIIRDVLGEDAHVDLVVVTRAGTVLYSPRAVG